MRIPILTTKIAVGMTLVTTLAEGLVLQQAQAITQGHEVIIWSQLAFIGLLVTIGGWAIIAFLNFQRKVPSDIAQLAQAIRDDIEHKHQENQEAIRRTQHQVRKLAILINGIDNRGGLIQDSEVTRERRHEHARIIQDINVRLYFQGVFLAKIGEKLGIEFDPGSYPHSNPPSTS